MYYGTIKKYDIANGPGVRHICIFFFCLSV